MQRANRVLKCDIVKFSFFFFLHFSTKVWCCVIAFRNGARCNRHLKEQYGEDILSKVSSTVIEGLTFDLCVGDLEFEDLELDLDDPDVGFTW